MANRLFCCITFILFWGSCVKKEFKKDVLNGIWSLDSVYCNNEYNNRLFRSNLMEFDNDKIRFPRSVDENYMKTITFCKKKKWNFFYADSLGFYLTYSKDCNNLDTAYVRFINDKNIKQLRFELIFKHVVFFGRKGLTYYPKEKDLFEKLESLSKKINLENIHPELEIEIVDTFNRFTQ
jgi:hypothetical protein